MEQTPPTGRFAFFAIPDVTAYVPNVSTYMPNVSAYVPDITPYMVVPDMRDIRCKYNYVYIWAAETGTTVLKHVFNDEQCVEIIAEIKNRNEQVIRVTCNALISCLENLKEPMELSFHSSPDSTNPNAVKLEFFPVDTNFKKMQKVGHNQVNYGTESKSMYTILSSSLFREIFIENISNNELAKEGLLNMLIGHAKNQNSNVVPLLKEIIKASMKK
jgi:hypothetical protein